MAASRTALLHIISVFLCYTQANSLPKWSWDTVQTFIQFANQSGTFGEEATEAFQKQAFVVFEKDQGRWPQPPQPDGYPMEYETNAETKIALACDQVKQASPTTDCYMYTESDWARTQYNLGNVLDNLENFSSNETNEFELFCDGNYVIKNEDGICLGCQPKQTFSQQYHAYNFRNEETRNLWVNRVVANMGEGKSIDGVFVDGNRNKWESSILNTCSNKDETIAWSQGLKESMWLLRKHCDNVTQNNENGCTIISNYPTEEALTMSDGGMIEKFGCSKKYIDQLNELSKMNIITQVHAQYAYSEPWFSWALACFLVGANEYSYFGAGMGWDGYDDNPVMTTWIKDWPEYSKPLGEPDSDAKVEVSGLNDETTTYFRSFATGTTVFVNLTITEEHGQETTTCIRWSDGSTTGDGCSEVSPSLPNPPSLKKEMKETNDDADFSRQELPLPVLINMLFP